MKIAELQAVAVIRAERAVIDGGPQRRVALAVGVHEPDVTAFQSSAAMPLRARSAAYRAIDRTWPSGLRNMMSTLARK